MALDLQASIRAELQSSRIFDLTDVRNTVTLAEGASVQGTDASGPDVLHADTYILDYAEERTIQLDEGLIRDEFNALIALTALHCLYVRNRSATVGITVGAKSDTGLVTLFNTSSATVVKNAMFPPRFFPLRWYAWRYYPVTSAAETLGGKIPGIVVPPLGRLLIATGESSGYDVTENNDSITIRNLSNVEKVAIDLAIIGRNG